MSVRIAMKNPPDGPVPRPGRLYLDSAGGVGKLRALHTRLLSRVCAARWQVVASIVVIDGGVCRGSTDVLRAWMHRRGWTQRSLRRLLPRVAAAALLLATGVAGLVLVVARLIPDNEGFDRTGAFWMFVTFLWAFSGWLLIYFAVHARRQRDARELELSLDARNAQLDLLRAQVNPHFLFNCLNSLRALITENPERASSMVTSLSDLLRYSLQSERAHTVRLADELAIVDEYVSLERVRFEDRLRFERALDPAPSTRAFPPCSYRRSSRTPSNTVSPIYPRVAWCESAPRSAAGA